MMLTNRVAERVIGHVSRRTGVAPDVITGRSVKRYAVAPRWRVIRLLRRLGYSTPDIGLAVNRDHSSVLYALGRLA